MKVMYVYILKCSDESYYTGVTNNLDKRLQEHTSRINKDCYTYNKAPVTLVFNQIFNEPERAIKFEKQIKGWTRAKKEALICGDFESLKRLSNKKSSNDGSTSSP